MSSQLSSRRLAGSIFSFLFLASINLRIAEAQVIPDGTLPTNVEQREMIRKITGGERVGDNLFHSFEEFSIPAGMEAIFENATDIQNIFTRITGSEASFIDGLLQTAGGANFFLVNPNGIVFGENAQIDVGGSFIATTANSIEFADGTSFIASGDEPKVTLTISVPIGLGLYGNNGSITVNGSGEQITRQRRVGDTSYVRDRTSGLSVQAGETLALVGKGINFDGGAIITEGGKIEIGSVNSGKVKLEENSDSGGWKLGYQEVTAFENINFNQNTLIDPSGGNNSSIAVYGQDITLKDNSILLIQNNETKGDGTISVNASALLEISNNSNITTETTNERNASPILISAQNLLVQDRGGIVSGTFGLGEGGNINIVVSEKLELVNSATEITPAGIVTFTTNAGNSGNISLSTQELQAFQGGTISSLNTGNENGGDINITADLIELDGTTTENGLFTFIGSISLGQEGADAGNVNLQVSSLKLINGAGISSDSNSNAASGNVSINATESVEVIGGEPNLSVPSSITSSVTVEESETIRSIFRLPSNPSGNAGNVNITTPTLNVSQGGTVRVINQGSGNAGTLNITADNLNLDQSGRINATASSGLGGNIELNTQNLNISNDSQITAAAGGDGEGGNITINTTNLTAKKNNNITASANQGEGGNITINADNSLSLNNQDSIATESASAGGGDITINTDQLQIDNNSKISTSTEGEGNGGNITINTDIVTALNNSRVTANAIEGDGGNITINTEGYFVSDDFIIDASSEFGLDGVITINAPENDLQKDLKLFNLNFSAPDEALVSSCSSPNRERGRFLLGGGSAFALSSERYYSETDLILDFEKSPQTPNEETVPEDTYPQDTSWQKGDPIIPADKIVYTSDGRAFLVASSPQAKDLACQPK